MKDPGTYSAAALSSASRESAGPAASRRLLRAIKRRWFIFAPVWLIALAVGFIALTRVKPLYRPQAVLEVRPEMPLVSAESAEPAVAASLQMWGNYYRTQESLLRSPSLVQAVFKSLSPEVSRVFLAQPDPIKSFLEKLEIEKTESSFILKVGFVDADAPAATEAVNTLVALYLEDANRRLRELKSDALDVLTRETVPAIQQRLMEAEKSIQSFHKETGFVDFDEKYASLVEAHRRVTTRLSEIRLRRLHLASDIQALQAGTGDGLAEIYSESFQGVRTLEPLASQRSAIASDLAREEQTLKEKHPRIVELKKQLAAAEDRIREALRGAIGSMEANLLSTELEEKSLADEEARVEREMASARRDLGEFKRLDSALVSARDLYASYVKKQSESRATSASGLASVRIVDRATVPLQPYKRPTILFNVALVLGIVLGLGAVWLAEQVDGRFDSARDLEPILGLEVLGEIPAFKGLEPQNGQPLVLAGGPDSAELEPFRSLRGRILAHLEEGRPLKVLLVTSPETGEGKSTVAINLARTLAMDGRRVLLLDAELRHPRLKALLGDPRRPGLEELLRGEVSLQQAVQPCRIEGVDLIGADQGLIGAAEQAASLRFRAALKAARERYDYVVIDSAPVNLVSETATIARRADATLLVVREGRTRRGAAEESVKRLLEMKVGVLGAVLTGGQSRGTLEKYLRRRFSDDELQMIEAEGDDLVGIA